MNPLRDAAERARAVDPNPSTWRRLDLELKVAGRRYDVVLLRPLEWVEERGARPGGSIHLHLPEMGLNDRAQVLAVGPCPPVRPGQGRVVTGTFRHLASGNLVDVAVEGLAGPVGCTTTHPFWSEDRRDFVPALALRAGERLRTLEGIRRVVAVRPRPRAESACVYNLEVDGEHVFQVARAGILVHNVSPPKPDGYTRMQDHIPHLDNPGTPSTTQLNPHEVYALHENLQAVTNRTVAAVRANIAAGRPVDAATAGLQGQLNLPRFRFIDQVPGGRDMIDAILREFPNLTFPH
jgi:hypothetical protein